MRNFLRISLVGIVLAMCSVTAYARNVRGILVEADNGKIIVYLDGTQVSSPTRSCFIANLSRGYYDIDVYSVVGHHSGYDNRRGHLICSERVYYGGRGIEKISIDNCGRPGYNDWDDDCYPGDGCYPDTHHPNCGVMPPAVFNDFFRMVKREPFDDGRLDIIAGSLRSTLFTSAQCKSLLRVFSFDSGRLKAFRMLYPSVVDKQNIFIVLDSFSFSSSRKDVREYLEDWDDDDDRCRYPSRGRDDDDDYDDDDDDYDD